LVCWSYTFCGSDTKKFVQMIMMDGNSAMIDYINEQADFFECFSENGKVARAIYKNHNMIKSKQTFNKQTHSIFLWIIVLLDILLFGCIVVHFINRRVL